MASKLNNILNGVTSLPVIYLEATPKGDALAKYICDLSNGIGGHIIVGMDNGGGVVGVNPTNVRQSIDKAKSLIIGTPQFTEQTYKDGSKRIVLISVTKSVEPLKLPASLNRKARWVSAGGKLHFNPDRGNQSDAQGSAQAKKSTESLISSETTHKRDPITTNQSEEEIPLHPLSFSFSDNEVSPCFRAEILVEAFISMIRDASPENPSNTCFFGVFGNWGRGKSFFLHMMRDRLNQPELKHKGENDYQYIEFNAWKYQRTPEIWYHLHNVLYSSKSWFFKAWTWMRFNCGVIVILLILAAFTFAGIYLIKVTPDENGNLPTLFGIISGTIALITAFYAYVNGFLEISQKKLNSLNSENRLGEMAIVEKRLKYLLRYWNSKLRNGSPYINPNRKVILAVEDIDRCDDERMIEIIEALKLVLENEDVRRRLIVIVAVDSDKLLAAYESKFHIGDSEKDLGKAHELAVGQMDKIFLSGINLPYLTREEQLEYILKLASRQPNSTFSVTPDSDSTESAYVNSVAEVSEENDAEEDSQEGEFDEKVDNLNVDGIVKILTDSVTRHNLSVAPPRKLRIIFYRLVLANNLLRLREEKFDKGLMVGIIKASMRGATPEERLDYPILDIVVPY